MQVYAGSTKSVIRKTTAPRELQHCLERIAAPSWIPVSRASRHECHLLWVRFIVSEGPFCVLWDIKPTPPSFAQNNWDSSGRISDISFAHNVLVLCFFFPGSNGFLFVWSLKEHNTLGQVSSSQDVARIHVGSWEPDSFRQTEVSPQSRSIWDQETSFLAELVVSAKSSVWGRKVAKAKSDSGHFQSWPQEAPRVLASGLTDMEQKKPPATTPKVSASHFEVWDCMHFPLSVLSTEVDLPNETNNFLSRLFVYKAANLKSHVEFTF